MSGLDPRTAARLILAVRFTLGPLCVLFPRFASRWLMFIPPKDNPGTPYFLRLFGGRDTYLGFAALIAEEPTRSQLLGAAAAVDAVDACSALVAGLRGNLPKPAAFFAAAAGTVGSALGLAAGGHLQLAKDRQSAS